MNELLPCPMCGSPAIIDSTSASECYGKAWQTLWIECDKSNDIHCDMSLNMTADFWYIKQPSNILIEAWNKLDRK